MQSFFVFELCSVESSTICNLIKRYCSDGNASLWEIFRSISSWEWWREENDGEIEVSYAFCRVTCK